MVSFESFGTVSYLPSTVTMAVSLVISEIFSIKEWPDLAIWVWGRSRSLEIVRFNRLCIIIIIIITDLYSAFRSEDTEALDAAQED